MRAHAVRRAQRYDAIEGAPQWARTTLDAHAKDPREHTYTQEQVRVCVCLVVWSPPLPRALPYGYSFPHRRRRRKTQAAASRDARTQFERGLTADALFNAAAHQLERTGKMHYYIRMYWVKKVRGDGAVGWRNPRPHARAWGHQILEWSPDAAAALGIANAINDRYVSAPWEAGRDGMA